MPAQSATKNGCCFGQSSDAEWINAIKSSKQRRIYNRALHESRKNVLWPARITTNWILCLFSERNAEKTAKHLKNVYCQRHNRSFPCAAQNTRQKPQCEQLKMPATRRARKHLLAEQWHSLGYHFFMQRNEHAIALQWRNAFRNSANNQDCLVGVEAIVQMSVRASDVVENDETFKHLSLWEMSRKPRDCSYAFLAKLSLANSKLMNEHWIHT